MSKAEQKTWRHKILAIVKSPKTLTYLLGVVGWIVVLQAMPFDWSLPTYAEF